MFVNFQTGDTHFNINLRYVSTITAYPVDNEKKIWTIIIRSINGSTIFEHNISASLYHFIQSKIAEMEDY